MRIYHQRGCFVSIGGTLSEFTPDAITGTVQLAGTATNVEGPLAGVYDAVKHRWYINANAALYADGTGYEVEWSITRGASTYGVTEWFNGWIAGSATDTTPPGPASIAVTSTDDNSITVAIGPPSDADYDHTTLYALSTDGTTIIVASSTGPTDLSVTIPGLPSGDDGWVVGVAYDTSGNASIVGVGSIAAWQTRQAATPAYPLYVEHYFDDETTPYATETLDQEGDGAQRLAGAGAYIGQGRRYRCRVYTWAPVKPFELRGVDILMATRPGQVGGLRNELGNR